jgi:hypothetical protein
MRKPMVKKTHPIISVGRDLNSGIFKKKSNPTPIKAKIKPTIKTPILWKILLIRFINMSLPNEWY